MITVVVKRRIAARPQRVFEVASAIEGFPDVNPDVLGVEILTPQREGVGVRFRETRRKGRGEMRTELEVVEYDATAMRIRMVTDLGGTVWDTLFTVRPAEGGAEVEARMECRAHKLLPRLLNPLLRGLFRKGMEDHLDHFQAYCERGEADGGVA